MYTRVLQLHRPEIETVCSEERDKLMHRAVMGRLFGTAEREIEETEG